MREEGKEGGAGRGEVWLMLENEARLQLGHMGGEADGITPFNTLHFSPLGTYWCADTLAAGRRGAAGAWRRH